MHNQYKAGMGMKSNPSPQGS